MGTPPHRQPANPANQRPHRRPNHGKSRHICIQVRNTATKGAKQAWGGVWRSGVKHAGDHPATHHDYRGGLLAPTLVPVSRHKLHRACLRPVQLEAATADAYGVPTPAAKKRVIGLCARRAACRDDDRGDWQKKFRFCVGFNYHHFRSRAKLQFELPCRPQLVCLACGFWLE